MEVVVCIWLVDIPSQTELSDCRCGACRHSPSGCVCGHGMQSGAVSVSYECHFLALRLFTLPLFHQCVVSDWLLVGVYSVLQTDLHS